MTVTKRDDMVVHEQEPYNAEPPRAALAGEPITGIGSFYSRNHGTMPATDPDTWRLVVDGLVERALSLSLEDLRTRFTHHEVVATLQCAGNRRAGLLAVRDIPGQHPWGPTATSTARWGGARLTDVLDAAGLRPGASDVEFLAPDVAPEARPPAPYGGSIAAGKAVSDEVLLAWEMNGEPLPVAHGAPVRVVVPGWIGARSVKWVERITVRDRPSDNFFQQSAYRLVPPDHGDPQPGDGVELSAVALNSEILAPDDGAVLAPGPTTIGGYAFAGGDRDVVRVDVSTDGGSTWRQADLDDQLSPWAWRLWHITTTLPAGEHEIVARAWDSTAALQPEHAASLWNPKGYINNAWPSITVTVRPRPREPATECRNIAVVEPGGPVTAPDDRDGAPGRSRPERVRVPTPLLKHRIRSGRGATEQPNAPVTEPAALTPLFWVLVVLTGVGAGLVGALLMALLTVAEHLAFSYDAGSFESGAEQASLTRRMVAVAAGGVIAGVGWFVLRRYTQGQRAEVDDVVWNGDGRLSWPRSVGTSVLSEIVVGTGASVGREAAPRLMGGVVGSLLADRAGMSAAQRRLLVACGAAAGFSAVYNVPLGGAVLAAEVLWGSITLPVVLPALACSVTATLTAWISLPDEATYPGIPSYPLSAPVLVWSVPAGLLLGLLAVGFVRLVAWFSHHRPTGWRSIIAPLGAMLLVGAAGLAFPQLFGNGKSIAHDAFLGQDGLLVLLAVAVLKPVLTALCLGSGISGGLFTPALSTGAALGGVLGGAWSLLWPGTPIGGYALVGAVALLSAAMQAPLAGLVLVLELTHSSLGLMVPMVIAAVVATAIARRIDGYSIYSGRLPSADR